MRMALVVLAVCAGCGEPEGRRKPPSASTAADTATPSTTPTTPTPTTTSESDCPDESIYTWENFASPLLTTWCVPCHSSAVVGEGRSGAPEGIDFDRLEDVRMWAPLILVTTGPDGSMPPAGGITEAERSALAEWIACDLPADETMTSAPASCETVVYTDDVTTLCVGDANAYAGDLVVDVSMEVDCLCRVSGDLVAGTSPRIEAPSLTTVGGSVRVDATSEVVELLLPSLETVGESLSLTAAPALQTLDVGGIETVGSVHVVENPALEGLYLDDLVTLSGDLHLESNALLRRLEVPRVVSVMGSIRVVSNPELADFDNTRSVLEVGGDLLIEGNDALVVFNGFPRTLSIGGDLTFTSNYGLEELVGLHSLEFVGGDFRVSEHPQLRLIQTALQLKEVGGLFQIEGAPRLMSWVGNVFLQAIGTAAANSEQGAFILRETGLVEMPSHEALVSVGDLQIVGNDELRQVMGFTGVEIVGGDLEVLDNGALQRLAGFARLKEITGALELGDNSVLTSAEAFVRLRRLGGDLVIVNNPALRQLPPLTQLNGAQNTQISQNSVLRTLDGLESFTGTRGFLTVSNNAGLMSLRGLDDLTSIGETLTIERNPSLTSIESIHGIERVMGSLVILGNALLEEDALRAAVEAIGEDAIAGDIDLGDIDLGDIDPGDTGG